MELGGKIIGRQLLALIKKNPIVEGLRRRQQERAYLANDAVRNVQRAKFLRKHLPPGGVGAELGVYKGEFSPVLREVVKPSVLHLIDPWYHYSSHWHWGVGNLSTVDALVGMLRQFKPLLENGEVVIHVGDDCEILQRFPSNSLDWAYVDSSHEYEHTRHELNVLSEKIKPHGIIAGDDWRPDKTHRHHGVCKAVTEFVDEREFEFIAVDLVSAQWAIGKLNSGN